MRLSSGFGLGSRQAQGTVLNRSNELRRTKRVMLTMPATLYVNSNTYPATILNMSISGFRIECAAGLKTGDGVELQVGEQFALATICWVADSEAGGEFDSSVDFTCLQ